MWPSSVFGTSTPSLNMPDPRPVPSVSTNTTPALAGARPEAHLGQARGVGVVQDVDRRLEGGPEVRDWRS